MGEDEARACFLACVQAGAVIAAIQDGRSPGMAMDVIGTAWGFPPASIPRADADDPLVAAQAYVAYEFDRGTKPDWMPR